MRISIDKARFKLYVWIGLAYLVLAMFGVLGSQPEHFVAGTINYAWSTIYIIALNFMLFEYSLRYISRRRLLKSVLLLMGLLFLYSFGLFIWKNIGILFHIYTPIRVFDKVSEAVGYQFPFGIVSIFFFGGILHMYDYRKLKKTAQQLRIEKQEAELNYLKSQTNPHFLFNTLNNIYSLARDKSDLAPESILRLSKILRFMLYETSGNFIAIEQELKIMYDYIELEKLRYDDSLHINFNYDIEDMKQAMPPLLLIPLVENAFKHGVSETRNQPFVDIHLSVNKRQLEFRVKNSSEKFPDEGAVKENIGLSNLRRQLELLYKEYNLSVQQGESVFTSTLKINLASHV